METAKEAVETLPATVTHRAFNGHVMEYPVTGRGSDGDITYSQWNAWHSDECPCTGDEPLPDW